AATSASTLTQGAHTILAEYLGDTSFLPSSATRTQTVAAPQSACTTGDASHLCLQGRFLVDVAWKNPYAPGSQGVGTAVRLTTETGTFWFFEEANVELMLKILDGRSINGRFWVLFGALSDVEYTITIRDVATGAVKIYDNPPRHLGSFSDINAFSGRAEAVRSSRVSLTELHGKALVLPAEVKQLPRKSTAASARAALAGCT